MRKTEDAKKVPGKPAAAPARKNAATGAPVVAGETVAPKRVSATTAKVAAKTVSKPRVAAVKPKAVQAAKAPVAKKPAATKSAPAAKEKVKKPKLIRDSFTMPETEYAALGEVKKLCLKAGVDVKKSELLRIGVAHLRKMNLLELKQAIASLAPLKAGRPKKGK